MKRTLKILSALLAFIILSSTSCEDPEPFISFKQIETEVYNEIKVYRESKGIPPPFVQQFIIGKEAQLFSAKMAFGGHSVDTTGISDHWAIVHDKYSDSYNYQTLVQKIVSSASAADIVQVWKDDPQADSIMLLDYTQCAAGVEINNGFAYVTVMMMYAESN